MDFAMPEASSQSCADGIRKEQSRVKAVDEESQNILRFIKSQVSLINEE